MPIDFSKIAINSKFLLEELLSRGVEVQHLVDDSPMLVASYSGRIDYLIGIASSIVPRTSSFLADNQFLAKKLT